MLLIVLLLIIFALIMCFGLYLFTYLKPTKKVKTVNPLEVKEVSEEEKAKNKIENVSSKEIAKLALFLTVLGIICAGLLALVNSLTSPVIEKNKQKELEETLKVINVQSPTELTDIELVENMDAVYTGTVDGVECYVFQTTVKSTFKTITTLFVVSKSDKKIINVATTVGDGLTTHNMDKEMLESKFGLIGSTSANYSSNFAPVAGATISSNSIIWGADALFEQLKGLEG